MKKYIKILLLSLLTVLCLTAIAFIGCAMEKAENNSNGERDTNKHIHSFFPEWSYDETYHWHPVSCGHIEAREYSKHNFENSGCTVCHYYKYKIYLQGYCGSENGYVPISEKSEVGYVYNGYFDDPYVYQNGNYFYGQHLMVTAETTHMGYKFIGWYNEKDEFISTETVYSFNMPEEDVYLTAKWEMTEEWSQMLTELSQFDYTVSLYADNVTINGVKDKYIKEISIPQGVTDIGNSAFEGCRLLTTVTIPDGVTSIGYSAFSGCRSLTGLTIPDSVTSIGDYAFSGCSNLTSIIIPNSVTSIGYSAFSGCSSLTSLTIPDGVTSIGKSAFYGCSSLTTVNIPQGVRAIDEYSFYNCTSLTNVVFTNNIVLIDSKAFYNCKELETVYFHGTEEEWDKVVIEYSNDCLINATRYYYSENKPDTDGNYWHYDENGEIAVW